MVKTNQIDSIVISIFGIFVIETKNIKGIISGEEGSYNWKSYNEFSKLENGRYILKTNEKEFLNPISQNLSHIKSLKKLLT